MKEISTKDRQRNNTCIIQKIKTRLTQIKTFAGRLLYFFKSNDKRKFEENKTRLQNVRQKSFYKQAQLLSGSTCNAVSDQKQYQQDLKRQIYLVTVLNDLMLCQNSLRYYIVILQANGLKTRF